MAKGTNTQRTLKYLRKQGLQAEIVERWLPIPGHPGGGRRKDLYGIIDIIALGEFSTWGIQSCGSAFSEHERKILAEPMAKRWLQCNNRLVLIGWRKVLKKRGGKLKVWLPRIREFMINDFMQKEIPGD